MTYPAFTVVSANLYSLIPDVDDFICNSVKDSLVDPHVVTPLTFKLFTTKVAALLIVTDVPLPIGDILSTLKILI